jgi:hypothetical protein
MAGGMPKSFGGGVKPFSPKIMHFRENTKLPKCSTVKLAIAVTALPYTLTVRSVEALWANRAAHEHPSLLKTFVQNQNNLIHPKSS